LFGERTEHEAMIRLGACAQWHVRILGAAADDMVGPFQGGRLMAGARQSLVWHGEAITEKMRAAQKAGVNATMGACVVEAKSSHAWQNRTGVLEGGIDVVDYAREDESGVVGQWGVQRRRLCADPRARRNDRAKVAKALKIPMPDGSSASSSRSPSRRGRTCGRRPTRSIRALAGRIRRPTTGQEGADG
jgi:hypothetical protein